MAIKPLDEQKTGNQDLELMMQDVKKFVQPLEDNPLLDGRLIEDIEFVGITTTTINHGLGRKPIGWIIVDKAGAGNIFRGVVMTDKLLTLANSIAVTCIISVWVF